MWLLRLIDSRTATMITKATLSTPTIMAKTTEKTDQDYRNEHEYLFKDYGRLRAWLRVLNHSWLQVFYQRRDIGFQPTCTPHT
jgi:hypothetical protein